MSLDLDAFRQNLTYTATGSIEAVLTDLKQLAETDKLNEERHRYYSQQAGRFGGAGCLSIGLVVLLLIVISNQVILVDIGNFFIFILVALAIGSFACAIYFNSKARHHGRLNLVNYRYRYEVFKKLIERLGQDMKPSAEIQVKLVLSKPDEKSKFLRKAPHPRRRGWTIEFYRDNWLTLKGRFLDDTRFLLEAIENYQIRSGRNVNNKLRIRPRAKGFEIKLDLNCPQSRYAALPRLRSQAPGAVQLPDDVMLKQIEVTAKGIELKAKIPPMISVEGTLYRAIALMFLSAYQILNLSSILTQRQASH